MNTFLTIARSVAVDLLGLASLAAVALGLFLQASTPYGFALTDGGGRLTDLGCFVVFLGILGAIAALLPLADYVDERGLWKGDAR